MQIFIDILEAAKLNSKDKASKDFHQPEASPAGEVADMELAIVSGRGPDVLTNIGGLKPLVRDEDIVLFGCRDEEQAKIYGSQSVHETNMHVFDQYREYHELLLWPSKS